MRRSSMTITCDRSAAVTTPPFTVTRDASGQITGVTYAGNSGQTAVNLSETSSINPSTDGTTNAGLGDFINGLCWCRQRNQFFVY